MCNRYAIYTRVSTQRQGRSGLGLESQQNVCKKFISDKGGEFIKEFRDVESGTHRDRKGLLDAISFCKTNDCALVFAKLDRLARDVEFCFKVVNTGIEIHFCDMPQVNTLILGIFATIGQYERELVSSRTKAALAVKKAQGCKLGASNSIYRDNYNNKTTEQRMKEHRKKGITKNARYLENKNTVAFFKVLRRAFPDACAGEPTEWNWSLINTREENREKVFETIREFKEIDPTLFPKWAEADLDIENPKSQVKLANQLNTLHKSVLRQETINNTFNN